MSYLNEFSTLSLSHIVSTCFAKDKKKWEGQGHDIFLDFSLLVDSWPWESTFCVKTSTYQSMPLCKLVVENKKSIYIKSWSIAHAKPDDFIRRHFNQNYFISSSLKLAPGMSSGIGSSWPSAMLVILNLLRLTSMQLLATKIWKWDQMKIETESTDH